MCPPSWLRSEYGGRWLHDCLPPWHYRPAVVLIIFRTHQVEMVGEVKHQHWTDTNWCICLTFVHYFFNLFAFPYRISQVGIVNVLTHEMQKLWYCLVCKNCNLWSFNITMRKEGMKWTACAWRLKFKENKIYRGPYFWPILCRVHVRYLHCLFF